MKIFASIAVEKVARGLHSYTFRSEVMECEVVRVLRYRCDRIRFRHTYHADIIPPSSMHPEYVKISRAMQDDTVRVNIVRPLNPKWKPPIFPEGINVLKVPA